MSLYLKYRPQDFGTMVGQEHAITTIRNALKNQSAAHAYLFCGPRGTGKTSLARILAKAINCQNLNRESEPCNQCPICQSIYEGRMVDLIEIDAASNRGIDEIRELREKINFTPSQAKAKVYIIDEVHMLTKEAFNALLKTLEEPPGHAYFILATTEAHKIPETIISRCQQFNFKRIGISEIADRLKEIAEKEKIKAEKEALNIIAKVSNGGLRDAIGLFEQLSMEGILTEERVSERLGLTGKAFIEDFFQMLQHQKPLEAMNIIRKVNAEGKSLSQFATEVIQFLRQQMLVHLNDPVVCHKMMEWIDSFNEARLKLGQASIPQLPLEMAVIKMCGFKSKDNEISMQKISEPLSPPIHHQRPQEPQNRDSKENDENTSIVVDKEKVILKEADVYLPTNNAQSEDDFVDSRTKEKQKTGQGILTLIQIQQNWPRVLNGITTPFVKMSLMDGRLTGFDGSTVFLEFNSITLMEKVQISKNYFEVTQSVENVFQMKLELKMEVRKINLNSTDEKKLPPKTIVKENSMMSMAEEVFGTE